MDKCQSFVKKIKILGFCSWVICFIWAIPAQGSNSIALEEGVRWKSSLKNIAPADNWPDFEEFLLNLSKKDKEAFNLVKESLGGLGNKNDKNFNLLTGAIYLHFLKVDGSGKVEKNWGAPIGLGQKDKHLFCISGNRPIDLFDSLEKYANAKKISFFGILESNAKDKRANIENKLEEFKNTIKQQIPLMEKIVNFNKDKDALEEDVEELPEGEDPYIKILNDHITGIEEQIKDRYDERKIIGFDKKQQDLKSQILSFEKAGFEAKFQVSYQNVHEGKLKQHLRNNGTEWTHSEPYFLFRMINPIGDQYDDYLLVEKLIFRALNNKENYIVDRAVIVMHSTSDMCSRCTIDMARQYASKTGFVNSIQQALLEFNKNNLLSSLSFIKFLNNSNELLSKFLNINNKKNLKVNLIMASRQPYDEGREGVSSRRDVNFDGNEELDFDEFWEKRLIVQWPIPIHKLSIFEKNNDLSENSDSEVSVGGMFD